MEHLVGKHEAANLEEGRIPAQSRDPRVKCPGEVDAIEVELRAISPNDSIEPVAVPEGKDSAPC
jgi:hypothetical protein